MSGEDLYGHVADVLRHMEGGVTGPSAGKDKTWVYWPEDCICDPAPDNETTTHSAACPFFDDRLLAVVTVEIDEPSHPTSPTERRGDTPH